MASLKHVVCCVLPQAVADFPRLQRRGPVEFRLGLCDVGDWYQPDACLPRFDAFREFHRLFEPIRVDEYGEERRAGRYLGRCRDDGKSRSQLVDDHIQPLARESHPHLSGDRTG